MNADRRLIPFFCPVKLIKCNYSAISVSFFMQSNKTIQSREDKINQKLIKYEKINSKLWSDDVSV